MRTILTLAVLGVLSVTLAACAGQTNVTVPAPTTTAVPVTSPTYYSTPAPQPYEATTTTTVRRSYGAY